MTSDTSCSETSPLLGEPRNGDAADAVAGNGTLKSNGYVSHREEEEAGRDDEADRARLAQFEGLPEAQKLLKYIVPAVSVGV